MNQWNDREKWYDDLPDDLDNRYALQAALMLGVMVATMLWVLVACGKVAM